jgi:hypothetical protein
LTEKESHQNEMFDETFEVKMHQDQTFDTREGALEHLYEHEESGDVVPDRAIDRLEEEVSSKEE